MRNDGQCSAASAVGGGAERKIRIATHPHDDSAYVVRGSGVARLALQIEREYKK